MRLSSTPPNNFSKASVNQPSSLQQRQGLDLNSKEASKLGLVHNRATCNTPSLRTNHTQAQEVADAFGDILNLLKSSTDGLIGRVVTTQNQNLIDKGNRQTLEILHNQEVVHNVALDALNIEGVMEPLRQLLQDLPRLAERNRPMAKILRALRAILPWSSPV
jgi:hypothetical protein